MGDETDSCGLRIVESIWPTSEADGALVMKSLSSCISVLIHFFLSSPCILFFHITSLPPALPPSISIHFLSKSPEHLFGLVMGAQLSRSFPYEAANNLLCGPQYPGDCKNIWMRGSKREGESLSTRWVSLFAFRRTNRSAIYTSGASDANHQLRSSMWREKYPNKWSTASLLVTNKCTRLV